MFFIIIKENNRKREMRKFLNILFAFALFLPFTLKAAAFNIAPKTGDTAIIISVGLVVIAIALFIFIRRRKR